MYTSHGCVKQIVIHHIKNAYITSYYSSTNQHFTLDTDTLSVDIARTHAHTHSNAGGEITTLNAGSVQRAPGGTQRLTSAAERVGGGIKRFRCRLCVVRLVLAFGFQYVFIVSSHRKRVLVL